MRVEIGKVDIEKLREEIERIKRQRIEEAKKLRLAEKCTTIARVLGKSAYKGHGYLHTYQDAGITIVYDDYGENVDVYVNGRKVLDVHRGEVELYVPGLWVQRVEELYRSAAEVEERRRIEEELARILEEANKWGIDVESLVR
jgi:hypothetical protein